MNQTALKTFLKEILMTNPRPVSHIYVKLAQPFVSEDWHIVCLSTEKVYPNFRNNKGQLCGWVLSVNSDYEKTGLYELSTTVF